MPGRVSNCACVAVFKLIGDPEDADEALAFAAGRAASCAAAATETRPSTRTIAVITRFMSYLLPAPGRSRSQTRRKRAGPSKGTARVDLPHSSLREKPRRARWVSRGAR